MNYEINEKSIAILPIEEEKSRIIDSENEYYVETKPFKVIEHSCEYFGSSYNGRHNGTYKLIGIKYKSPIIIEESSGIIMFPTHSPINKNCIWLSLDKIIKCYPSNIKNTTIVEFKTGDKLEITVSYRILNNQILKATRLKMMLQDRLKKIKETI